MTVDGPIRYVPRKKKPPLFVPNFDRSIVFVRPPAISETRFEVRTNTARTRKREYVRVSRVYFVAIFWACVLLSVRCSRVVRKRERRNVGRNDFRPNVFRYKHSGSPLSRAECYARPGEMGSVRTIIPANRHVFPIVDGRFEN